MKKTALLAAAAALMAATPAAANGYLGLEYSDSETEFIGDLELETWQGEGAFGWGGPGVGFQIGGSVGNAEIDAGGDADFWGLDGHVYWHGGAWRVGGVVATTQFDFGAGGDLDETTYGAEAMVDIGSSANIYGSLTASEADFLVDVDAWNLDVGGNFYATPNVRLGGTIGTGNVDFGGTDADTMSFGVNGEFQPFSFPLSFTAGYNYFEIDDASIESNALQVGARWNFGGGTLQDRNNATPFTTPAGFQRRFWGVY